MEGKEMRARVRHGIAVLLLSVAIGNTLAFADYVEKIEERPEFICSPWAEEILQESYDMKFGPKYQESYMDMTKPLIRRWAFIYTERFIAMQYGCGAGAFFEIINCRNAEKFYTSSDPKSVFSDANPTGEESDALYYLDVVKGRGEGIVDWFGTLTRQEAATVLKRTYESYGGVLAEPEGVPPFLDDEGIASWAKEAVYALAGVGIFLGYDDGRFAPLDEITGEQYIAALYRLYANLPVGVKNNNVPSLFTYDELVAMIKTWDTDSRYIRAVVRGPIADYYELEVGRGSRYAHISPVLVFHSGAIKYIEDLGVCNDGNGALKAYADIEDPHFSEDGKTLYYTVSLPDAVEDFGNRDNYKYDMRHGHQAGTYNIAIKVDSLSVSVKFLPVSEG
ncbi:MAG: S-layer homology domain-containing protein [Oscillospiraceae bacterium]|nr:S-layer homology domain-containing protein [Oscillospiraceae bacterium]